MQSDSEIDQNQDAGCNPDACEQLGCGMHDSCGEVLDCGVCECENGQPSTPNCGSCGLGSATCSPDNEFTCDEAPEISGMVCSELVFANGGVAATGDGTKEDPFNTYLDAHGLALTGGYKAIILTGDFDEHLAVIDGVHVLGGFDVDWNLSTSRSVFRTSQPVPLIGMVGILADDISSTTVVESVSVETGDAEGEASNYGALVRNSSGLVFRHVVVIAGNGGTGVDGVDGLPGQIGGNGTDAPVILSNATQGLTLAGGTNPQCAPSDGGFGGSDADEPVTLDGTEGLGGDGENVVGALGGRGTNIILATEAEDGRDGTLGVLGNNGNGGPSDGTVTVDGVWSTTGSGTDGVNGTNGGGGSGGGGTSWRFDPNDGNVPPSTGSQGGSGGAGGCGGFGGLGGTGGGGSFGLFTYNSDLTLDSCSFSSGFGGVGGNGGDGGVGGIGGRGGLGSIIGCRDVNGSEVCVAFVEAIFKSGDGGGGGSGGTGGNGGGGAGGVSYGGYCFGTSVTFAGENTFASGGSAFGGMGGNPGEPGFSLDDFSCE